MKLLARPSVDAAPAAQAAQLAAALFDAAQATIRLVRAELRRRPPVTLSLSQLRALGYLTANPDASLSGVAHDVGVSLPSASVLIDGLVRRALVVRFAAADDRRRVRLRVTAAGKAALRRVDDTACAVLTRRLRGLAPRDRALVAQALRHVAAALAPERHA